jgi:hypothetical protein
MRGRQSVDATEPQVRLPKLASATAPGDSYASMYATTPAQVAATADEVALAVTGRVVGDRHELQKADAGRGRTKATDRGKKSRATRVAAVGKTATEKATTVRNESTGSWGDIDQKQVDLLSPARSPDFRSTSVFAEADTDGDCQLSKDTFIAWYREHFDRDPNKAEWEQFKKADKDGDGSISLVETAVAESMAAESSAGVAAEHSFELETLGGLSRQRLPDAAPREVAPQLGVRGGRYERVQADTAVRNSLEELFLDAQ